MALGHCLSKMHRGRRRLSLPMQLVVAFIPALLFVCLACYLVYTELRHARVANNAAASEIRAIAIHHSLIKSVVDAETGLRGFLITGDSEFLAPYRTAGEEFSDAAESLSKTYGDDPAAGERLRQIRDAFEYWNEGVAQPLIEARKRTPPELDHRADRVRDLFTRFVERLEAVEPGRAFPRYLLPDLAEAVVRLDLLSERTGWTAFTSTYEENVKQARALRGDLGRIEEDGLTAAELESVQQAARSLLSDLDTLAESMAGAEASIVQRVSSQAGKRVVDRIRSLNGVMIENRRADRDNAFAAADFEMTKAMWTGVVAPFVAFGLGLVAMAIVAGRAVRRIHQLQAVADDLGHGNLSARVPVIAHGDELNELGHRFNRMAAELDAARTEAELMARFRDLLVTSDSADEAFRVMERLAPSFFPGTEGCIYLIAESRNVAIPMAAWPESVEQHAILRPSDCRGLRAGRTHELSSDTVSMMCPHLEHAAPTASVCVPLIAQDNVLGLLTVWLHERQDEETYPSRVDGELALRVGEQLALFLANLHLREQLRDQSIRDPLTGLFNRRYLDETLERELARALRHESTLSVLALDIDHFKRFNDTHGHEAGDVVLTSVAAELQRWLRASDIACRVGGEEFLLVLPDAPLEVAAERAEQVRAAVSELVVDMKDHELPRVTISSGVAAVPDHADSAEMLRRRADEALYRAKHNGRNRVEIATLDDAHGAGPK